MTVGNVIADLNAAADDAAGRLALRVWQIVTTETPVDTGFARGAWQVTTASPATEPSAPPRDRERRRAEGASNFATANAFASSLPSTYRSARGPIWISNNVPYIGVLNDGRNLDNNVRFIERSIALAVAASR